MCIWGARCPLGPGKTITMKHAARFAQILSLVLVATATLVSGRAASAATTRTTLQTVACPDRGVPRIDLYNQNGQVTGLKIDAFEPINRFQGWGKNEVNKRGLKFLRVQIPGVASLSKKQVYLYEGGVQNVSACESRRGEKSSAASGPVAASGKPSAAANDDADDEGDDEHADAPQAPEHQASADTTSGGGLASVNCCRFPLQKRPTSYLAGKGRFGAGRKGGRAHGGADLYGKVGQAVYAVAPGKVIRSPYYFKSGTLAVDVRHKGGFVVRYGEISNKNFGLVLGKDVATGQQLGAMKYVPGAPAAMLHFELYKGNLSGKLSGGRNKYHRRGDLINPTPYLQKWKVN